MLLGESLLGRHVSRYAIWSMAAIHQDPEVLEDLTPYAGSWVAIRDGKVVASALGSVELRDNPEVQETDLLMPVPDQPAGIFVL
jgi:hypothetical protein